MSRDNEWVHLMDNFYYAHWHSKSLTERIDELGKEYEIFTCSVGDCDESFEFKYFKNGQNGKPMMVEREAFNLEDQLDCVLYITHSLAIEIPNELNQIISYHVTLR